MAVRVILLKYFVHYLNYFCEIFSLIHKSGDCCSCADISDRCGGDSPPLRARHRHHHPLYSEEEEEAEVEYQPL